MSKINRLFIELSVFLLLLCGVALFVLVFSGKTGVQNAFVAAGVLFAAMAAVLLWLLASYRKNDRYLEQTADYLHQKFSLASAENAAEDLQGRVSQLLQQLHQNMDTVRHVMQQTGEGKTLDIDSLHQNDNLLLEALGDMNRRLRQVAEEERVRNWLNTGMDTVTRVLSGSFEQERSEVTYNFVKTVCQHTGACQGAVFLYQPGEGGQDGHLVMSESYAWDRRKYLKKQLLKNEGLTGQCFMEKQYIYLEQVPENYVNIKSGLGDSNPRIILLVPVIHNDEVFGVVELASFEPMQQQHIEFLQAAAERLGAAVFSVRTSERTRNLLAQSRKANDELLHTEEMMRLNMEEMFKMQSDLSQKVQQMESKTAMTEQLLKALESGSAFVEYDRNGNVLDASQHFAEAMGYTPAELEGKPLLALLQPGDSAKLQLENLHQKLNNLQSVDIELVLLDKNRGPQYTHSLFLPVADKAGKLLKVLQMSRFTNTETGHLLRVESMQKAFDHCCARIEADSEGNIMWVSDSFYQLFGYSLEDLVRISLGDLLQYNGSKNPQFLQQLWQASQNTIGRKITLECRSAEGHYLPCQAVLYKAATVNGLQNRLSIVLLPGFNAENQL